MTIPVATELIEAHKETASAKLEISELWKFGAAIGISCAISLFGHTITDSSKYVNTTEVKAMIDEKHLIVENEMKHYGKALEQLTVVVDNNTKVLYEIKEELAANRGSRNKLIDKLDK